MIRGTIRKSTSLRRRVVGNDEVFPADDGAARDHHYSVTLAAHIVVREGDVRDNRNGLLILGE
jgi:hypothetical protein